MKKRCAITGASGYVGSRIAQVLASEFDIVPLGRNADSNAIRWTLGETGIGSELERRGVEVLVHCAWDMRESSRSKNWQTNVAGSRTLTAEAVAAGVKKIIFISTISSFDQARSEYGKSKFAVEETILAAGGTVIRPGLVWADRAGGTFEALRRQVSKGGLVPMIGHGRYPQFLVHEDDLGAARHECGTGANRRSAHPGRQLSTLAVTRLAHQSCRSRRTRDKAAGNTVESDLHGTRMRRDA